MRIRIRHRPSVLFMKSLNQSCDFRSGNHRSALYVSSLSLAALDRSMASPHRVNGEFELSTAPISAAQSYFVASTKAEKNFSVSSTRLLPAGSQKLSLVGCSPEYLYTSFVNSSLALQFSS